MEKPKANARTTPFNRDSWYPIYVSFLRKKQVLSGQITRHPRKSETLYRPLDVQWLEKRRVQRSQAMTSLALIRSVKCLLNLSFYRHGIWSPYTRQVLQLLSPKANCVICYCVRMCVCVCLGSDEGGRSTGRTFCSLEYCYLVNYRELCSTRFPEAFKICWESFLARLYHTIYTAFG